MSNRKKSGMTPEQEAEAKELVGRFHSDRASRNGHSKIGKPADKKVTPRVRSFAFRTLAAVEPKPTSWAWQSYIPLCAVSILDGNPGLGKSTIALDLGARASRGGAMPPLSGRSDFDGPADVLILNAEDSPEQTIRPRLEAAGADLNRCHIIEATSLGKDNERPPVLPADLDLLEELATEKKARLVIIDPLMAFLDAQIDSHRDQDVRRCLHRLKLLAEKTGAAVLLVRHLNKLGGGPAIFRGGGSIGISGAARSVLVVGKNPASPEQCVLAPVKCNLCKMPPSLTYSVETMHNSSVIGWGEETQLDADAILGCKRQGGSVAQECAEMLTDLLADGPRDATEVEEELKANGYSKNAIRDARKLAKAKPERQGYGAEGKWVLRLFDGADKKEAEEGEYPPDW